jgi:hypothetical protein
MATVPAATASATTFDLGGAVTATTFAAALTAFFGGRRRSNRKGSDTGGKEELFHKNLLSTVTQTVRSVRRSTAEQPRASSERARMNLRFLRFSFPV